LTLTELRYITAVASEHHFGRAAQPTLSVAVRNLGASEVIKMDELTRAP
jgi:DNA-binding transcriptional LysR family regulator